MHVQIFTVVKASFFLKEIQKSNFIIEMMEALLTFYVKFSLGDKSNIFILLEMQI